MEELLAPSLDWPLFPPDSRGFYHRMVSLIISQRVRFRVAQAIRRRIYALQACASLDRVQELTEAQRREVGLSEAQWAVIQGFDSAFRKYGATSYDYSQVSGIGPWTVGCERIMAGDYSGGFVFGDLSVRRLCARLLGRPGLSEADLRKLVEPLPSEQAGALFSKLWNHTRTPARRGPPSE